MRRFLVRALAIAALFSLALGAFTPARGAAQEGAATQLLRERHERLLVEVRRGNDAEVARMLRELLDYPELARRSLGSHWEGLGEAQRAQFVELLGQLVECAYRQNLTNILDFTIEYVGEEGSPESTVVRTMARSRTQARAEPISIDYSMRATGEGWRVFDVTTDGVSLVRNYNRQFNRIISRDGWDALIRRMEERRTETCSRSG